MSLNYDKSKAKESQGDSFWSSYSDLFMVLSLVFLLLFVTATLRGGTNAIKSHIEFQKLAMEAEDLREQNRVYDTLKEEAVANAAAAEQEVYKNLMDKLSLLSDEARLEKEELRKKAAANEQKEESLNQYQQIVRNIINANMLAKSSIKTRDEVIDDKKRTIKETRTMLAMKERDLVDTQAELVRREEVIDQNQRELSRKAAEIENLQSEVDAKKDELAENEQKIRQVDLELAQKIKDLKQQKMSKEALQKQISKVREQSKQEVEALQRDNQHVAQQLATVDGRLSLASKQLEQTEAELAQQSREREELENELRTASNKFESEMAQMKNDFEQGMTEKEEKFKEELAKQKLSAAEKAEKEKEFREQAEQDKRQLEEKLGALSDKIKDGEKQLAEAKEQQDKYKGFVDALKKEKEDLEKDLKKSQNFINQKKKIAKAIKDNFKKAAVDVAVDGSTGDVYLTFGKEYFETGRSDLKPAMANTLHEFMPAYAKSLFEDDKISDRIESVEIIGFSSPTYAGKYVDPQTLSPGDRKAVNYNLDLSYQRARSIFQYIFDTNKMTYDYQRELLPLVKVTGRSFLAEEVKGRAIDKGISQEEFCSRYDCKRSQKVVIKFNLKN